jgi:hypothetical protein
MALPQVCHAQVVEKLPDLIVDGNDLLDNQITNANGVRLLRVSTGTPNIGTGILQLQGGQINPDGTQEVLQRIFRSDGSFIDVVAGDFTYHPTHMHIHVENWTQIRLRQWLPGDGVGSVIVESQKTSFCVLDLQPYNTSLPGFSNIPTFASCGSVIQGLSVGWKDLYTKGLDGQQLNITGVPPGQYWIEAEVNPARTIVESNLANNITRVRVTIPDPMLPTLTPDPFEPNDTRPAVDARPIGGPNSPNLGPCGPIRTISGLTIDSPGAIDLFKFYSPALGRTSDYIQLNFDQAFGDLDVLLLNAAGTAIDSSTGVTGTERVSMRNKPAGWYYVQIYGYENAINQYSLTIAPSANAAPTVVVTAPPVEGAERLHAVETYPITWNASDPDGNPTWVTVMVNTLPVLDAGLILIPNSVNTPGQQGLLVLNTAYLDPGQYWIYCQITDGGTVTGSWSAGTLTLHAHPPCPGDFDQSGGTPDSSDIAAFFQAWLEGASQADVDGSGGTPDASDIDVFFDFWLDGCE